jgi:hypothetical protein
MVTTELHTSTNGAAEAEAAEAPVQLVVPAIDVRLFTVRVVSDTPLICHAWSDKALRIIEERQAKKAKAAKPARVPWEDFVNSLYWVSDRPRGKVTRKQIEAATFGFPVGAFKDAAVGACRYADGVKMTTARGAFHLVGERATIIAEPPIMRTDMVRIAMGTADVRYRAHFENWAVDLTVRYNAASLTPEQIVNLINIAGFGVGVGDWRPEHNGSYGQFHVATIEDVQE